MVESKLEHWRRAMVVVGVMNREKVRPLFTACAIDTYISKR